LNYEITFKIKLGERCASKAETQRYINESKYTAAAAKT